MSIRFCVGRIQAISQSSSPPSSISPSILLLLRHSAARLRTRSCHALTRQSNRCCLLRCMSPVLAQSGSSLRRTSSVAIGRRADIGGSRKLTAWPCQPRSASDRDGHCEGASSRSNDYATAPLASWKGRLMRCTVHKAGAPPQRRRQGRCGPIRGQCAPGHS